MASSFDPRERPVALARSRSAAAAVALATLAGCSTGHVAYEPTAPAGGDPIAEGPVPDATLFLLGDAGAATPGRDRVLAHFSVEVERAVQTGAPVVVVYLGDNVYEEGARADFARVDRAKLAAQIAPVPRSDGVRTVFVPGNHDWGNGGPVDEGRDALVRQSLWLADLADGRHVALLPQAPCPGPATLDVTEEVRLLFIDTEWLLRDLDDRCGTPEAFYDRLSEALAERREGRVVVMAHHPLASGGPHGGNQSLFGGVPTISYFVSKAGVALQDLRSRRYTEMIARLEEAFRAAGAPPLVYAAGHEHNLQVVRAEGARPSFRLVSGSVAKRSRTDRVDGTRFAAEAHGYMRLDFAADGVRLVVFGETGGSGPISPLFACSLLTASGSDGCPEASRAGGGR